MNNKKESRSRDSFLCRLLSSSLSPRLGRLCFWCCKKVAVIFKMTATLELLSSLFQRLDQQLLCRVRVSFAFGSAGDFISISMVSCEFCYLRQQKNAQPNCFDWQALAQRPGQCIGMILE
jgi:hypothetical protein